MSGDTVDVSAANKGPEPKIGEKPAIKVPETVLLQVSLDGAGRLQMKSTLDQAGLLSLLIDLLKIVNTNAAPVKSPILQPGG